MNKNLFFIFLFFSILGCNNSQLVIVGDVNVYKVEITNDIFSWDDFVEKVEIIPLETTANSLIGIPYKGVVSENDIYMFDFRYQSLINFDIDGKFKKKIGEKGKGPEEYLEIRDFCVVGNYIYTLDFQKIHRYNKITGKKEDTWSFDNRDGFNPMSMFVFDKSSYFLWNSKPDVRNPGQSEYYRMHKMQEGKVIEKFFKYEYPLTDDSRFYPLAEQSCYMKPIDGEDIIYKLTRDTLSALFKIDFGRMAITIPEIIELKKSQQPNAYLKSNKFKNISTVLEVKEHIFFTCIGPDARSYEGYISKKTGHVEFGTSTSANPRFFFSDGTFLYGYYEPFLLDLHRKNNRKGCFDSVWLNSEQIKVEDNIVLVKVHLK